MCCPIILCCLVARSRQSLDVCCAAKCCRLCNLHAAQHYHCHCCYRPVPLLPRRCRAYKRETAVPRELAQRIARLETDAYHGWVAARKASDFSAFAPFLQQWVRRCSPATNSVIGAVAGCINRGIWVWSPLVCSCSVCLVILLMTLAHHHPHQVDINRQKAAAIDPNAPVYDVLLDDYEKGMTAARLDEVFAEVQASLERKRRTHAAHCLGSAQQSWAEWDRHSSGLQHLSFATPAAHLTLQYIWLLPPILLPAW